MNFFAFLLDERDPKSVKKAHCVPTIVNEIPIDCDADLTVAELQKLSLGDELNLNKKTVNAANVIDLDPTSESSSSNGATLDQSTSVFESMLLNAAKQSEIQALELTENSLDPLNNTASDISATSVPSTFVPQASTSYGAAFVTSSPGNSEAVAGTFQQPGIVAPSNVSQRLPLPETPNAAAPPNTSNTTPQSKIVWRSPPATGTRLATSAPNISTRPQIQIATSVHNQRPVHGNRPITLRIAPTAIPNQRPVVYSQLNVTNTISQSQTRPMVNVSSAPQLYTIVITPSSQTVTKNNFPAVISNVGHVRTQISNNQPITVARLQPLLQNARLNPSQQNARFNPPQQSARFILPQRSKSCDRISSGMLANALFNPPMTRSSSNQTINTRPAAQPAPTIRAKTVQIMPHAAIVRSQSVEGATNVPQSNTVEARASPIGTSGTTKGDIDDQFRKEVRNEL